MECKFGRMASSILDSGKRISHTGKGSLYLMKRVIWTRRIGLKVSFRKERRMDMENWPLEMDSIIKVNGRII